MDITEKFEKLVDEHHQKDANGEPIPHDDEEGISEGTALQVRMALDDAGLKGKWKNNKVYVKKKDVEKAKKALKGNVIYKGKPPEVVGEEAEIKEYGKIYARKGSDYELYHKTFSAAMQHAYAHAKKKGFTVDPKEIDNKVATGPKKPSSGKTNRYILGTDKRKKVHIQVANLDNKRYELNMYIESAINHSAIDKVKKMIIKEKYVTQDKMFPKTLMDGIPKAIPGVKLSRYSIKHPRTGKNIPGLGLMLPGDKGIRVMIQFDKEDAPAPKGMPKTITDIDPDTKKKEVTDTSFRDSYAVWINDIGKIWKPNVARWIQAKDFRDPSKVVQFLKTKVKRMVKSGYMYSSYKKEEVELDEGKLSYHKKLVQQHRQYAHNHDTEQGNAEDEDEEGEYINDHSDAEDAHNEAADMHQKVLDSIKKRGEKDKETKKLAKMAYNSSKQALDIDIDWRYSGQPRQKIRLQREEVEIQEHCGECEMGIEELREVTPKQMSQADKLKMWNKLKSGGTIKLWFNSSMSKGSQWREFKIGRKSKSAKHNLEKISMNLVDRPGGVKYYLYNRKGMISLAIGDMGASLISMKEDKDLEKMVKELEGASKMHLGQSKRIAKYLNKKKEEVEEGIDIEKASMGAVIKDFQKSDAPQFKGKSDKKRKEMAIAAKLSKEENEDDDPVGKSKKKDKINIKPKMEDKQMKKLKELQAGLREKRAQQGTLKKVVSDYHREEVEIQEVEIDEMSNRASMIIVDDGLGLEKKMHKDAVQKMKEMVMDEINLLLKKYRERFKWNSDYQRAPIILYVEKEIEKDVIRLLKKGGLTATVKVSSNPMKEDADADMKAAREKKERERKRAIAARQADAYRGIEKSRPTKDKARLHPESVVKEAVLDNGIEVGEQDWDLIARNDAVYPNLNVNFAKYIDEGLEGPYDIGGEVYFYDRKVQMFYSVSSEDYVDEETAKDIAYRLHKNGFYKPELGR